MRSEILTVIGPRSLLRQEDAGIDATCSRVACACGRVTAPSSTWRPDSRCGGAPTRIVCGFLGTEDVRGNPVIAALPAALRLDVRHDVAAEWVRNTFRYAAEEIEAGRLGSETVMAKLSELLLVEAIRRYAESLPEQATGWLAGLRACSCRAR